MKPEYSHLSYETGVMLQMADEQHQRRMKTIIAGSRRLESPMSVDDAVSTCGWSISEVVCGCAFGADRFGELWAKRVGVPIKYFPADWVKNGKAAGPIRNRQMAEYAEALILVWDGESRGSASMLKEAEKRGLRIHQHIVPV